MALVDASIDKDHPLVIRRQLAQQVYKLLRDNVSPSLIREALAEWDTRPDAGPPMLPHLVSTVIRRRRAEIKGQEHRSSLTEWEQKLQQELNE